MANIVYTRMMNLILNSTQDLIRNLIVLALVFTILYLKKTKSRRKGKYGELRIRNVLKKLSQRDFVVMNDIILESETGTMTSQIDHLVISKYGIFVIETKNYSGTISGDEMDRYWIQRIGSRNHEIMNPIRQNYGHIKAIRRLIHDYQRVKLFSIIAYPNKTVLKVSSTTADVVHWNSVVKTIKRRRLQILEDHDVMRIVSILSLNNARYRISDRQHIKNLRLGKMRKPGNVDNAAGNDHYRSIPGIEMLREAS